MNTTSGVFHHEGDVGSHRAVLAEAVVQAPALKKAYQGEDRAAIQSLRSAGRDELAVRVLRPRRTRLAHGSWSHLAPGAKGDYSDDHSFVAERGIQASVGEIAGKREGIPATDRV